MLEFSCLHLGSLYPRIFCQQCTTETAKISFGRNRIFGHSGRNFRPNIRPEIVLYSAVIFGNFLLLLTSFNYCTSLACKLNTLSPMIQQKYLKIRSNEHQKCTFIDSISWPNSSASWPKLSAEYFGRFCRNFRPNIRFRSYTKI